MERNISRRQRVAHLAIAIVLVLAGAGVAAQNFTARVVLSDDSIRHGSFFHSQFMHLEKFAIVANTKSIRTV
jgi:hypothetical protein